MRPACPLGRGLAVRAVARAPGDPLIGKRARWIALGRMAIERGIPDAGDEIDLEGLDPKGTVQ